METHRSRRVCIHAVALASLVVIAAFPCRAQESIVQAQRLQREAAAAYQAGNVERFTALTEQALAANPASQATRYNLACGYARTGRAEEAMALLTELAEARIDFGMEDDPDLESLRERPDFRQILAALKRAIVPISNSTHVHTMEQLGLLPEGIAIDPASGRIFFGSMRNGEIFVLDRQGQLAQFATVEHDGKAFSAIGMKVDAERRLLWVAGSLGQFSEDFVPDVPIVTGAFGFDLETAELRHEHLVTDAETAFNDVAIGPAGEVYLSGGRLSRVPAAGGAPVPLTLNKPIAGTNGITVGPDGTTLFVSVYPAGLARVDIESGRWGYLDEPDGVSLVGIDGLYWYEGDLVGIQNGIQPWRLLRMDLGDDGDAVIDVRIIEFANDRLTASTGTLAGKDIIYIGPADPPREPPRHFPAQLAPFLGKTVIMRAPLD